MILYFLSVILALTISTIGWILLNRLKEIYQKKKSSVGRFKIFCIMCIIIQFLIFPPYAFLMIMVAELSNLWLSLSLLILLSLSGLIYSIRRRPKIWKNESYMREWVTIMNAMNGALKNFSEALSPISFIMVIGLHLFLWLMASLWVYSIRQQYNTMIATSI